MRNSIKVVLLSAFIFPGAGHFSLKKRLMGSVLVGVTLVCLYFLITTVLRISQDLKTKIESGEIPYDISKITELASEKLSGGDDKFIIYSSFAFILCWIFGVVDSFRLGRLQDKNDLNKKTVQKVK